MQHSTQIAREWVREPIKCAQTFDGIYLRFIDCYPERVPKGNPIYDAVVREIPPREDLQGLKLECVVLRGAYRLAQPRQPKLTVPIEVVNNFFDAIVNRDRAAVRTAYSEFAGYVSDMHRHLQIDEPELSPAEFVRCLADDVEKGTPSDELTLSGSKTDDEFRDRYRCDYLRLAGKPLGELPQVVLTFAVGLWEKVGLPTIEMELQSLRLVIAKYIHRRDSIQGGNSELKPGAGSDYAFKNEAPNIFRQAGMFWEIRFQNGSLHRCKHVKGFKDIQRLLSQPNVPIPLAHLPSNIRPSATSISDKQSTDEGLSQQSGTEVATLDDIKMVDQMIRDNEEQLKHATTDLDRDTASDMIVELKKYRSSIGGTRGPRQLSDGKLKPRTQEKRFERVRECFEKDGPDLDLKLAHHLEGAIRSDSSADVTIWTYSPEFELKWETENKT